MSKFIEITDGFGNKRSIRKDLILSFAVFKMKENVTNENYIKFHEKIKATLIVQIDSIEKRYGEEQSHKMNTSIYYVQEYYLDLKELLK